MIIICFDSILLAVSLELKYLQYKLFEYVEGKGPYQMNFYKPFNIYHTDLQFTLLNCKFVKTFSIKTTGDLYRSHLTEDEKTKDFETLIYAGVQVKTHVELNVTRGKKHEHFVIIKINYYMQGNNQKSNISMLFPYKAVLVKSIILSLIVRN